LLDLSWKPPWRNFCAFKFSRAKGVSRCKTSRYLNVCYPWCPFFSPYNWVLNMHAAIRSLWSMLWSYTSTWRTDDCCGMP
jgi:hypothetical protein